MKNILVLLVASIVLLSCEKTNKNSKQEGIVLNKEKERFQDSIIKKYVANGSKKFNFKYQMSEWQQCLDKGLKVDSTIAYLWQQKAMPYFKVKKYEIGMSYIDKAVKYNREEYQPYRAFIKCIFAKTYKDAIVDFEDCRQRYGNNYVMDHTYNFYIGISCLQLNEFEKAEQLLEDYVDDNFKKLGEEWGHPTALFYLGIAKYELKKYKEAIVQFDRALKIYTNLADAKYYKSICLMRLGDNEGGAKLINEFYKDSKQGYTLNEDNIVYEVYPYQLTRVKD